MMAIWSDDSIGRYAWTVHYDWSDRNTVLRPTVILRPPLPSPPPTLKATSKYVVKVILDSVKSFLKFLLFLSLAIFDVMLQHESSYVIVTSACSCIVSRYRFGRETPPFIWNKNLKCQRPGSLIMRLLPAEKGTVYVSHLWKTRCHC